MALERLAQGINWQKYAQIEKNRYICKPEQLLALRVTKALDDQEHKELYLRLCKYTQEAIIEQALSFVSDAKANNKGKLFLWKVKQIKNEWLKNGKNPRKIVEGKKITKQKKVAKVDDQEDLFAQIK